MDEMCLKLKKCRFQHNFQMEMITNGKVKKQHYSYVHLAMVRRKHLKKSKIFQHFTDEKYACNRQAAHAAQYIYRLYVFQGRLVCVFPKYSKEELILNNFYIQFGQLRLF